MAFRSIARAIWRQDVRAASRMQQDSGHGRKFSQIACKKVVLQREEEFRNEVLNQNAARHEKMQDEAASRARSNPREATHWGKMQDRPLRRALLWRPRQRRLVLKGAR
eukprot:5138542-Pyramimonas_sp.AAC.1